MLLVRGTTGGVKAEMGFFFIWVGTSYLFIFNSMVRWEYVICRKFPACFFFSFVSFNLLFPIHILVCIFGHICIIELVFDYHNNWYSREVRAAVFFLALHVLFEILRMYGGAGKTRDMCNTKKKSDSTWDKKQTRSAIQTEID